MILENKDKKPKCAILHTNEDVTTYFMEIKCNKTFLSKKLNTMNVIRKKDTIDEKKLVQTVFKKSYDQIYTGCLYQTHTLIELLDLKMAKM